MKTTKVFKSGHSQAVRIPKEFQLKSEICRCGSDIILREPPKNLAKAFELLTHMLEDCLAEGRKDAPLKREKHFSWLII